jgi:hypothetical protein
MSTRAESTFNEINESYNLEWNIDAECNLLYTFIDSLEVQDKFESFCLRWAANDLSSTIENLNNSK